jgi:hypothetical protein
LKAGPGVGESGFDESVMATRKSRSAPCKARRSWLHEQSFDFNQKWRARCEEDDERRIPQYRLIPQYHLKNLAQF